MLTLAAAVALLFVFLGAAVVWTCALPRKLSPDDRVALAPVVAILFFAALTATALVVPWNFATQSTLGLVAWTVGALVLLGRPAVRGSVIECGRRSWILLVPVACCFLAVAAFGTVQGDPPDTVAYPGSILSARVTNLPPDNLFPVTATQLLQNRINPVVNNFYGFWDFADRTPLAGAVTASLTAGAGDTLPRTALQLLPPEKLRPKVNDDLGYWQVHLVLVLLNALVVVGIGRLALSIFGRRAALIAGLLAASNPFVFTHVFFTWPKMLAAFFVLLNYAFVRERRHPLLIGGTAGLAYLAHPLAAIFVIPSLLVALLRAPRRGLAALGVLVATLLPWQLWTTAYAHPSRMLTYPLGYTMTNPNNLRHEFGNAWRSFTNLGLGHALHVRLDMIVDTIWPFDMRRNFLAAPTQFISGREAWFTVHDRTLGGMLLFALIPIAFFGLRAWYRSSRVEWIWMLVGPLALAVLFWGIDPQGLGAALLQPTAGVLIVVAAGGFVAAPRWLALVAAIVAAVEAGSVVWWGLFAERGGAGIAGIGVAAVLWAAPMVALIFVLIRRPPAMRSPEPIPRREALAGPR